MSAHNFNFDLTVCPGRRPAAQRLRPVGLEIHPGTITPSKKSFDIPTYFNLDAVLAYDFGRFEVFVKATNLFDDYIYTEPIFPWRARFFEFGVRIDVF